jgi:general stress protein YciG
MSNIVTKGKPRGFAVMNPDLQRKIASKGGKAAHAAGTAHQWSSEEARAAGRIGGLASRGGRGKTQTVTA